MIFESLRNHGIDAIRNVLPEQFNWPLFIVALLLMSAPIIQLLWPLRLTSTFSIREIELAE